MEREFITIKLTMSEIDQITALLDFESSREDDYYSKALCDDIKSQIDKVK